jgi:hypothetical protein
MALRLARTKTGNNQWVSLRSPDVSCSFLHYLRSLGSIPISIFVVACDANLYVFNLTSLQQNIPSALLLVWPNFDQSLV